MICLAQMKAAGLSTYGKFYKCGQALSPILLMRGPETRPLKLQKPPALPIGYTHAYFLDLPLELTGFIS